MHTFDASSSVLDVIYTVTYRITAKLSFDGIYPNFYKFKVVNRNTGEQIGSAAILLPPNANSRNAFGDLIDVIHTPSENGEYCLKMDVDVVADHVNSIRHDVGTYMNIVQVI